MDAQITSDPTSYDPTKDVQDNIGALFTVANRMADQQDSFNQKLSFIMSGTLTYAWSGASSLSSTTLSFAHGLGYTPIFLVYYNLSTEPNQWRLLDDFRYNGSGTAQQGYQAYTDQTNINCVFSPFAAGTACTITFKFYILREPAQQIT